MVDITHPYKLLTSKYIKYNDDFDESYDSMYLLLAHAYLLKH